MFYSINLQSPDDPLGKLWWAAFTHSKQLRKDDVLAANIPSLTGATVSSMLCVQQVTQIPMGL